MQVAILEASRVWEYQDEVPCLGYICKTKQNNVIIFRVYGQSLFITVTSNIQASFTITELKYPYELTLTL